MDRVRRKRLLKILENLTSLHTSVASAPKRMKKHHAPVHRC
jgi:hypothetical protein